MPGSLPMPGLHVGTPAAHALRQYPRTVDDLLPGREFAEALRRGDAPERFGSHRGGVLLVDGDDLPDDLGSVPTAALATLPTVVVSVGARADAPPGWADLAVAPASAELATVTATVAARPMAATVLAVLLRTGGGRSVAAGLVAESTAYGLLQAGPEFAAWREATPARHRPDEDRPAVLVERDGDELTVTLHRPSVRNALDAAMRDELVAALDLPARDPTIARVHLRGAGDSFCSGGDLDEFGSRPDPVAAHLLRLVRSPARALAAVADRTVAHLHGHAYGSGIELAAGCAQVVAAPSTRIALPEVRIGLVPGAGGTVTLPRRIGRHATLSLALGHESIDAETALGWGLVDEVTA